MIEIRFRNGFAWVTAKDTAGKSWMKKVCSGETSNVQMSVLNACYFAKACEEKGIKINYEEV